MEDLEVLACRVQYLVQLCIGQQRMQGIKALQRKRIGHRFAIGIALLPVPILAGLIPVLLRMPAEAATGWWLLTVPIGALISLVLLVGLLRRPARAYFSEP